MTIVEAVKTCIENEVDHRWSVYGHIEHRDQGKKNPFQGFAVDAHKIQFPEWEDDVLMRRCTKSDKPRIWQNIED